MHRWYEQRETAHQTANLSLFFDLPSGHRPRNSAVYDMLPADNFREEQQKQREPPSASADFGASCDWI